MPLELTDLEARRLALLGISKAPPMPNWIQSGSYDALLAGRDHQGRAVIQAWLKIIDLGSDSSVLAWAFYLYEFAPRLCRIPDRDLIWLMGGRNAPAQNAQVFDADPILDLPGELDAYRLRRVLGVDPIEMVNPSDLIKRTRGLFLDLRVRSSEPDFMTYGFKSLRTKVRLIVEHEDGCLRETSAGFSLVCWFTSESEAKTHVIDWRTFPVWAEGRIRPFSRYFDAYQAFRLPGIRLLLEYRASPKGDAGFVMDMARNYDLHPQLVSRRLRQLQAASGNLPLL